MGLDRWTRLERPRLDFHRRLRLLRLHSRHLRCCRVSVGINCLFGLCNLMEGSRRHIGRNPLDRADFALSSSPVLAPSPSQLRQRLLPQAGRRYLCRHDAC